jgi:hypothetical protein
LLRGTSRKEFRGFWDAARRKDVRGEEWVDLRKSQERDEARLWWEWEGDAAGPLARRTGWDEARDAEEGDLVRGNRERRRKSEVLFGDDEVGGRTGPAPWKSGPSRAASLRLEALMD